jgi:hypothetical protein
MSKSGGWLTYVGRLIAAKLRAWLRLIALYRETMALEQRRDELLMRLGRRYQQYLIETRAEPAPPVAEIVADLRIVLQRRVELDDLKKRARDETFLYLHPELVAEPTPSARQAGAAARPTPASGPTISPSAPGGLPPGTVLLPPASAARPGTPAGALGGTYELNEEIPPRRGAPESGLPARAGSTIRCECGEPLPATARFCPACGKPMAPPAATVSPDLAPPRKCPYCGAELPFRSEFCPACGGHIDAEVYEM